jgi:ribose-phosphate pyrophosphokinase
MSSDAGGFKPLMRLCDQIYWEGETYSASKARTKNGMRQLVDRQDFGGKDILIVDDISVYGGTFKGLSKLLRERNCGKLYLAVSHMTVQDLGADPVTDYFDKVFTTNSKFDKYYATDQCGTVTISDLDNLEIINLF